METISIYRVEAIAINFHLNCPLVDWLKFTKSYWLIFDEPFNTSYTIGPASQTLIGQKLFRSTIPASNSNHFVHL